MPVVRPLSLLVAFSLLATAAQAQTHERIVQDTVDQVPEAVSVENGDGRITVSTWGRDSVAYRARIVSGSAEEPVGQTQINREAFADRLSITTDYSDVEGRWSFSLPSFGYVRTHPAVHYTLVLPDTTSLSLSAEDGEIDVEGLRGALDVEMEDGRIRVTDQRGTVRIDAEDGDYALSDVTGDLQIDVEDGTVAVDGLRGALNLDMETGEADVQVAALDDVGAAFEGGQMTLVLPENDGFSLSTDLGEEARVQSPLDLDALRNEDGNYQGTIGQGGPLVRLASEEGKIKLRANDVGPAGD